MRFGRPFAQHQVGGNFPIAPPLCNKCGYFAFASGRLLASGPWRTRARHVWHEWLLALVLAVWALWILDPVSRHDQVEQRVSDCLALRVPEDRRGGVVPEEDLPGRGHGDEGVGRRLDQSFG